MKTHESQQTPSGGSDDRLVRRWLVAEYCDADLFEGWHLYIRDKDPKGGTMRNDDNTWGWLRSGSIRRDAVLRHLATLGITGKCDGTMEGGAYHQLSEKFPVGLRRRCGRKVGAVEILIDDYGRILPPNVKAMAPPPQRLPSTKDVPGG